MQFSDKDILRALSGVMDPDLGKDLVTLGMIKGLKADSSKISLEVVLTTPACPLQEKIRQDCLTAIAAVAGNTPVDIRFSSSVTTTLNKSNVLPGVKNIIAVASGKGGVGKSTVTANLAVALAQKGASVGIIDADIFGPSVPILFNCEREQPEVKQVEGRNIIVPLEQYGVKLMSIGFLAPPDSPVVWRGPMASSALRQFVTEADWGELDYLLIDLPPGTSDIHLTLVQTVPVTGAVIVSTPQKVATADAAKGVAMFRQPQIKVPVLGIVENMAYFTPEELPGSKYFIFGQDGGRNLADKFKVPFLGQIPLVQGIRESGDNGLPVVMKDGPAATAFVQLAEELARQVAIRNATFAETQVVEVKTG
jgi:ATP-binding protein involved in chromosome partitioning